MSAKGARKNGSQLNWIRDGQEHALDGRRLLRRRGAAQERGQARSPELCSGPRYETSPDSTKVLPVAKILTCKEEFEGGEKRNLPTQEPTDLFGSNCGNLVMEPP